MEGGRAANLPRLLEMLYAALECSQALHDFAGALLGWLAGDQLVLMVRVPGGPVLPPAIGTGSAPEFLDRYLRLAPEQDPFHPDAPGGDAASGVALLHERIAERALRATALYTECLEPCGGLHHGIGACWPIAEGRILQLVAWRRHERHAFGGRERQRLRSLLPHLGRVLRLIPAQGAASLPESALDLMLDAVLMLDDEARVIYANRRAREVLHTPLRESLLTPRPLRLASAAECERLRYAIQRVRGEAGRHSHGTPLNLLRQPPLPPLRGIAISAARAGVRELGGGDRVVLFLRDPRLGKYMPEAAFRELYGMTPAQARISMRLLRGDEPAQIAIDLGVRLETVRAQIKQAMECVGTRRQGEFIRKLSIALPAVPDPAADPR